MRKKALVLAGGGTRGAYENGAVRALRELGRDDWKIVAGTSIGALNAALIVQKDYDVMDQLWKTLTQDMIVNGGFTTDTNIETIINERNLLTSFFKKYVKEKGADITPFAEKVNALFDPQKFFASDVDFCCVTVHNISQKPVFVTKEMMRENGPDWLLASASAFPAFPVYQIGENSYIDGGYFDNCPVDIALQMGAEEVIAIDPHHEPNHPNFLHKEHIHYIYPQHDAGTFLSFDRKVLDTRDTMGYLDTMKYFGRYDGVKYTFEIMALPEYIDDMYRDIMKLETRIKVANRINGSFRSAEYITDHLESQQNRRVLTKRLVFFGLMDNLLDLCHADIEKIWTYKEARDLIIYHFRDSLREEYESLPDLNAGSVMNYLSTLDQKGLTEKILHGMLYDQMNVPENISLTLYPFEIMLAKVIVYMMRELGKE